MARNHITKTSFVDGHRCPKLPWLDHHAPEDGASPTQDEKRRAAQGHLVGALAREQFPRGTLMPSEASDNSVALDETQHAVERGETTLFEAAFRSEDVHVVVDILQRDGVDPLGWHVTEVKATTRLKEHHVSDAAIQAHVLERTGLRVLTVSILHLNPEFRAPDDGSPFVRVDVTEQVSNVDVVGALEGHRQLVARDEPPVVAIGPQCNDPHPCRFKALCWAPYGSRTIFRVPKPIHPKRRKALIAANQIRLEDVDRDRLSDAERAGVDLILNRHVHIDRSAIAGTLERLVYPLHFLDFEAIDDAVPRHAGAHPYQHVPFQFSVHVLSEDGALTHHEYLHEDASDPRPQLITRLLESVGPSGTVVAYHDAYERKILKELGRDFPEAAPSLRRIADRLWDQRSVFKAAYIDHRFEGRTSIKKVLPVLCPDLTYASMPVSNGTEAMATWDSAVHGRSVDRAQAFQALREYCRQDTLAMVRIHEALRAIAAGTA